LAVSDGQHQTERLIAILFVFQPDVTRNNGFDALIAAGFVKLDHAENVHQIRAAERWHVVLVRARDRVV